MTRKTGQIISKSERKWTIRVYLGEDQTGKRKYYNKTVTGNKGDAQKALTSVLRELDLGVFIKPTGQKLNDYLDKWLETGVKQRVSPATYDSYEMLLRVHIRPSMGEFKLLDVKPLEVQKLYSNMLTSNRSSRTVRYVHTVFSMAMKQAVRWALIPKNPCELVELPKHIKKETKAFSPDQANKFLLACSADKHGLILEFALITGMRPEEYLALKWEDVDLDKARTVVRHALIWNRRGGGFTFAAPKTKQSRRTIPIPISLVAKLKKFKLQQMEYRLKLGTAFENLDLVFSSEVGRPIHFRNLTQRHLVKVLQAAGLDREGFTLYSLRHSCATLLLSANTNPKIVAERLGHSGIKLTLETYSHVLPTMQQEATDKLESMLYTTA